VIHPYLPTGLAAWDANGGLPRGIAVCIAAPTGEGKSAVKLSLARAIAMAGFDVGCFELEDPVALTADRTFAGATGLSAAKIGKLEFEPIFLDRLDIAAHEAEPWAKRIRMVEGLVTPAEVKAALEPGGAFDGCTCVMLDYAQGLGTTDLEAVIADIAWYLQKWAQRTNGVAVIFSQTKTELEERGKRRYERDKVIDGYRPMGKSDVKWSSALAERCKMVVFLFRPGRWARKHGEAVKDDKMEVIFDKANFGGEGSVTVGWIGPETRLVDLK
jgi:hypothetical protein